MERFVGTVEIFQIAVFQPPICHTPLGNHLQSLPSRALHKEAGKAKGTIAHGGANGSEQKVGEARFEPRGLKKCMCNVASQRYNRSVLCMEAISAMECAKRQALWNVQSDKRYGMCHKR